MFDGAANVVRAALAGVATHLVEAALVGGLDGLINEVPNAITDPNEAAIVVAICVFLKAEITGREKKNQS